jgi:hypothetical protein
LNIQIEKIIKGLYNFFEVDNFDNVNVILVRNKIDISNKNFYDKFNNYITINANAQTNENVNLIFETIIR